MDCDFVPLWSTDKPGDALEGVLPSREPRYGFLLLQKGFGLLHLLDGSAGWLTKRSGVPALDSVWASGKYVGLSVHRRRHQRVDALVHVASLQRSPWSNLNRSSVGLGRRLDVTETDRIALVRQYRNVRDPALPLDEA